MVALPAALKYLGIDPTDDPMVKGNARRALRAAKRTLEGAVGEDVWTLMPTDERADELVLIYTDDLYSGRGVGGKVSSATRRLVYDMELQLRLELRRLRTTEVAK